MFWEIVTLILLIVVSAFFSSVETAMMSVNRYRLRYRSRQGDRLATLVLTLLAHPGRLLSVILIGNTCANVYASMIITVIAVHYFGSTAIFPAGIVFIIILLVFAEITPKTFAASYSQMLARFSARILFVLQKLMYPLVWFSSGCAKSLLAMFGFRASFSAVDQLTKEELTSIVGETASALPPLHRHMLLGLLSLEQVTVYDAMVPKPDIIGIDLSLPWEEISLALRQSRYRYLPVYYDHINQLQGILDLRQLVQGLFEADFNKDVLETFVSKPYYIPGSTLIIDQLSYFQTNNQPVGLVVDEYGDIQGLLAMQDILEEVVGEFSGQGSLVNQRVQRQPDGSVVVDAGINLRDLNRLMNWSLPVTGAKTLSGLIIEELAVIPEGPLCIMIDGYRCEVLSLGEKMIEAVRMLPEKR